jgi:hypothetical protein
MALCAAVTMGPSLVSQCGGTASLLSVLFPNGYLSLVYHSFSFFSEPWRIRSFNGASLAQRF